MKKLILSTVLCSSLLFGTNTTTEDFFYQSGYEQGQKDGFEQGVREAFIVAKKVLDEYKEEIRAYEIGKYLSKEKYLTAPRIYQTLGATGDTLQIQVMKSRIEKELNIEDIFAKFGTIPTLKDASTLSTNTRNIDELNSVNLASRDNILNLPNEADKNDKIITVSIEKNAKNEELLKNTNAVYSLDNDNNRFKVMFFTRTEKDNFCNSFKICR